MDRKGNRSSYVHNVGNRPLTFATLGDVLEDTCNQFPGVEAIVSMHQGARLKFGEVLELADSFAAGLLSLGLGRGDIVGLWGSNTLEWYIVYLACARAGIIVVTLICQNQASEMEYCINKIRAKAIVCMEQDKYHRYYDTLKKLAPEIDFCEPGELESVRLPSLETVILISDNLKKGTYNYKEIIARATPKIKHHLKKVQEHVQPDDPLHIMFSSGTTGRPKAVTLSHFQVINNAINIGQSFGLSSKHHRICVQVPFFHAYGVVVSIVVSIKFSGTLIIPSPTYSPKENLKAIIEEKCTVIYGTPTMYVDLINLIKGKSYQLYLEIASVGAAPCTPHLLQQMKDVLKIESIKFGYGLSETSSIIFFTRPNSDFNSVGFLCEHMEAKVVDPYGKVVPIGTSGELYLRGPITMLCYYNDEEATKKVLDKDRWLKTGDLFVIREDGSGQVVGRIKDLIIRGGENIYPKEIEDHLITKCDILEVYVIGLPNERLGEEVCACVRLADGSNLSLQELREYCRGKMANFKIPTQLRVVDEFPKTGSGKVLKSKLREMFSG